MDDKTYGVIGQNPTSRVEVKTNTFNGRKLLHLRVHFLGDDNEWHPTKKGFTFFEGVQIDDMIALLQVARKDY